MVALSLALGFTAEAQAEPPQTGVASWYGGQWIGRRTANGERYGARDMTAAHRSLPFGTMVRVTNLRNHRSTLVRINNRGPYIKSRLIDLSHLAATELGMLGSGTARVKLEVVPRTAELASAPRRLTLDSGRSSVAFTSLEVRMALQVQAPRLASFREL
jgi:rare lipoprotein A